MQINLICGWEFRELLDQRMALHAVAGATHRSCEDVSTVTLVIAARSLVFASTRLTTSGLPAFSIVWQADIHTCQPCDDAVHGIHMVLQTRSDPQEQREQEGSFRPAACRNKVVDVTLVEGGDEGIVRQALLELANVTHLLLQLPVFLLQV